MIKYLVLFTSVLIFGCQENKNDVSTSSKNSQPIQIEIQSFPQPTYTLEEANKLIDLPLHCVGTPYPYKPQHTLERKMDLVEPIAVHPIFFGCFDWHSSVHGYWSMVTLLKQFHDMDRAEEVKSILKERITPENVATEVAFLEKPVNKSFERTYGWAWVLKLSETLYNWDDPMAKELYENIMPLADVMVDRYKE